LNREAENQGIGLSFGREILLTEGKKTRAVLENMKRSFNYAKSSGGTEVGRFGIRLLFP